jgi:hypothetical protein
MSESLINREVRASALSYIKLPQQRYFKRCIIPAHSNRKITDKQFNKKLKQLDIKMVMK